MLVQVGAFAAVAAFAIIRPHRIRRVCATWLLFAALLGCACTATPGPRSPPAAPRFLWKVDLDSNDVAPGKELRDNLLLVPDAHGGVAYVMRWLDGGAVAGRIGADGRVSWSRRLDAKEGNVALCVEPSGSVVAATYVAKRSSIVMTMLDARGALAWETPFAIENAWVRALVATDERLFIAGSVEADVSKPYGATAVGAFDLNGKLVFKWVLPDAELSHVESIHGNLVVSLDLQARGRLPRDAGDALAGDVDLEPGAYVVTYDRNGRLLSSVHERGIPASSAAGGGDPSVTTSPRDGAPRQEASSCHPNDLMCVMMEATQRQRPTLSRVRDAAPALGGQSSGSTATQRGAMVLLLRPARSSCCPECVERPARYALLGADARELMEWDALEAVPRLTLALGEDGSVFESGVVRQCGGAGAPRAYVARIR